MVYKNLLWNFHKIFIVEFEFVKLQKCFHLHEAIQIELSGAEKLDI